MGAKELPIWPFRQTIVETILKYSITVIIGETGSGKTTQIAQVNNHVYFLWEL